jgi:hypothetical protein
MTDSLTLTPELEQLGDALQAATTADLDRRATATATPARQKRRRRIAVGVVAAAILVPGAAVAATQLISNDDVAQSIPAGTMSLLNTHPTCTTIQAGVEFDCTLADAPHGELAAGAWKGTVEPTVDASKHVNGGCRSLSVDGRHWRCYIGQEAVRQQIVGPQMLGSFSSGPGVG